MAIAYTSAIQNRASLLVFGAEYSTLRAYEKVLLDNTWASGGLTGGVAKDALQVVQQFAQWAEMAGSATAPDDFEAWFVSEIAYRAVQSARPQLRPQFKSDRDDAMENALQSFTRTQITANSLSTSLTATDIRQHVISSLVRIRPLRYVPIEQIDRATMWCLNNLWNRTKWSFRQRLVTATIATDETVTITAGLESGETISDILTNNLYIEGSTREMLRWVSVDEMVQLRALTVQTTGRPRLFRTTKVGSTITWKFYPIPDTTYTIRFGALTAGPTLPSGAPSTTITQFPAEFHPTIRDFVLAKVMQESQIPGGQEAMARVEDDIGRHLAFYDDIGEPDALQTPRDVYGDFSQMSDTRRLPGWSGTLGGAM
jgi:hypothetical protein